MVLSSPDREASSSRVVILAAAASLPFLPARAASDVVGRSSDSGREGQFVTGCLHCATRRAPPCCLIRAGWRIIDPGKQFPADRVSESMHCAQR